MVGRTIIILVLYLPFFGMNLFGQLPSSEIKLTSGKVKIPTRVIVKKNGLGLQYTSSINQTTYNGLTLLSVDTIFLQGSDLVLDLKLRKPKDEFHHFLHLQKVNREGTPTVPKYYNLKIGDAKSVAHKEHARIIWNNVTEGILVPGRTDTLLLDLQLTGGTYRCEPPVFRHRALQILVAVISTGSFAYGLDRVSNEKASYREYTRSWSQDQPINVAKDFLDQAKDYDSGNELLTWGGLIVFVANVGLYMKRLCKHKNVQKDYNTYCASFNRAIEIFPYYHITSQSGDPRHLGLKLQYKF